jgi:hypothetical protein
MTGHWQGPKNTNVSGSVDKEILVSPPELYLLGEKFSEP